MAIIKCKMCGGDLNLVEGASTAECEFCGSIQTIPKVDDEKKLTLFARANRLRAACEFDKAAGIYEAIVADFPEESEAYWGLVLCKYGIEYVDDPGTAKKIPTCHRSSFESVMEDSDFEQAFENADSTARRVYRDEAKQIEELRKGIIAVSANEEPYDIFICYKETAENGDRTLDSVLTQDVYDALTDKGYRVFFSRITLEDKLGVEYEPYIFAALNSAKIMLVFGTDYEYFNAVWVKNEWSRYLKLMAKDKTKHLIPCYKGIDAYDMPKEFARLQAQDLSKVGATQDLLRGIAKILAPQVSTVVVEQKPTTNTSAMVMRGQFALDDGDWEKADEYFERALDENPEDAKAYVGKVLVGLRLSAVEQINDHLVKLEGDKNFERAIRFSTGPDKAQLEEVKEQADRKWYVKCLTIGLKKVARAQEQQAILEEIKKKELVRAQERREDIIRLLSADCEEYTIARIKESKCFSGTSIATSLLLEDLNIMIADGCVEHGIEAGTYCIAGTKEKRKQRQAAEKRCAKLMKELTMAPAMNWDLEKQKQENQTKLRKLRDKKSRYERQAIEIPGIIADISRLQIEQKQLQEKISVLNTEYQTLGLLALKQKKENRQERSEAEEELQKLQRKEMLLTNQRDSYPSAAVCAKEIEILSSKIAVQEEKQKELQSVSIRSKGEILAELKSFPEGKPYWEKYTQKMPSLSKNKGDLIYFGTYKQGDSIKDICWRVLDKKDNRLLVISKYAVDFKPYNINSTAITWERSSLRKWLNDEFVNTAFTADEKAMIPTITVPADRNPDYNMNPGNATQDKVFLLSITEANKYFSFKGDRICKPDKDTIKGGVYSIGIFDNYWWWLRSPGCLQDSAAGVDSLGVIDTRGYSVIYSSEAVRPAMWIDLNA